MLGVFNIEDKKKNSEITLKAGSMIAIQYRSLSTMSGVNIGFFLLLS